LRSRSLSAALLDNSKSSRKSTPADSPSKSTINLRSQADPKLQSGNGDRDIDANRLHAYLVEHVRLNEVGRLETF
jgi:hypothetical protein